MDLQNGRLHGEKLDIFKNNCSMSLKLVSELIFSAE